jgi:hypothetical protein
MPKYWCVNFEDDANLELGIEKNLWSMGYQYAHDQSDSPARKAAITRNWRKLEEINAGDKFVAYLRGKGFFAIGTVTIPRRARTSRDRTDTIDEYLKRGRSYSKGYVYFGSSVVYENFTDAGGDYPVRIDVERWDNHALNGVLVTGLNLPRHKTVNAVFEIAKGYFDRIAKRLASVGGSGPKAQEPGSVTTTVDDSVVEALEKSHAKSQGFLLDSKTRKALEDYAMDAAKRHFASLGYVVEDHSASHSYDLLCSRGKERLYVEVKGTQTNGDGIILTSGEVKFARRKKGQMALFIVHSIKVSAGGTLNDGQERVILPWDVDEGRLKPISFVYEVP